MSTLRKRKTAKGFVYFVDIRYNGRRHKISTKTSDRRLAQAILDKIHADMVKGTFDLHEKKVRDITLQTFAKEYLRTYSSLEKSEGTVTIDDYALRYLIEFLRPTTTLRSITESDARAFKAHILQTLSPTTVNIKMRALRAAFNWAMKGDRNYIDHNVFSDIPQLRVDKAPIRYMNSEQLTTLLSTIDGAGERGRLFGRFVRLLLFTGCRRNEALNLRWGDVDFQKRWITFAKTKTDKFRVYPMSDEILELLGQIRADYPSAPQEAWLFGYSPNNASIMFRRYLIKAGLPASLHLHCLRHTNAILHRTMGTHILDLRDLLGHSNLATTEIYTKAAPDLLRGAVSRVRFTDLIGGAEAAVRKNQNT